MESGVFIIFAAILTVLRAFPKSVALNPPQTQCALWSDPFLGL